MPLGASLAQSLSSLTKLTSQIFGLDLLHRVQEINEKWEHQGIQEVRGIQDIQEIQEISRALSITDQW